MPRYNVMVNMTQTIESSVEIEVSAKDEETAQAKVTERIEKAQLKGEKALDEAFNWDENSNDTTFEYEVGEA